MDLDAVDNLLRCLADPGRRQVARILADMPLTVGEIAGVLGLPQSTVSRHLKILRSTGLLVDRREGSRVYIGMTEPAANGHEDLADALNTWLRRQPLSTAVETRLRQVVESRQRAEDGFERLAEQWDELRFEHFGGVFHLEALVGLLPPEWRVLDIGTGTGYLLPFLARQFREVVAADASSAMLDLARQRAERERLENVRFKLGRLEDLPVEDGSIDCAVAILVLRHSVDLDRSMRELARAIKAHGRLLVVDVAPHRMEEFRRRIGDASTGLDPEQVVAAIEAAGFRILRRQPLPAPRPGSPGAPSRPAPDLFLIAAEKSGEQTLQRRK